MKMRHPKLFQGEYLFPVGSTYLLVNKYWGSSYFPVNNYWAALSPREYLLKVTPVCERGFDELGLDVFLARFYVPNYDSHTNGPQTPFFYLHFEQKSLKLTKLHFFSYI